jgi:hypothetical protein
MWGFPPNLMRPIVDQLGPSASLRWFVVNMPRYERTLSVYGPLRTHLLALTISLINGCPYCSFGHAFAFELAYFKKFDVLFPLDEHQLVSLHGQDSALIADTLAAALGPTPVNGEVQWVERMLALCSGAADENADDRRMVHLRSMFGVLNACGIAANTPPDQAHDPLNKDAALRQRYDTARNSAS